MRYIDSMPPSPTGNNGQDIARLSNYIRALVEQLNAMVAEINKKNGGS